MSDMQSHSILIADHNESFSQLASSAFRARQWEVDVVSRGKDVMKKLEEACNRGYWQANQEEMDKMKKIYLELENEIEEREE